MRSELIRAVVSTIGDSAFKDSNRALYSNEIPGPVIISAISTKVNPLAQVAKNVAMLPA
jgi:hypothetical protein